MVPASSIGFPFIELHSVDSTNNYATAMVHEGMAQHGTVVFAHEQKQGKGQRGKQWLTGKNEAITLSVIITPFGQGIGKSFLLSMAVALGMHRFFSRYAGGETKIKWPNDLYWRDRKAGGILIENVVKGNEWRYAIIGIGLNINQIAFPPEAATAVSLRQITGQTFDLLSGARELLHDLDDALQRFFHQPDSIHPLYLAHLYKRAETVRLKKGPRLFEAIVKGVTPEGSLIVQHALEEQFMVGEVEWIIK